MTQIFFYSINKGGSERKLTVACKLTEKAFALGHQVFIQPSSEEQLRVLDEILWKFDPSSFLPHEVGDKKNCSIQLGVEIPENQKGILINLSEEACIKHHQFSRINEIVGPDEQSLLAGRSNYRFYQAQGLPLETYKI